VVLAIPMSLLGTVAIIYFLGFTLNTFTLLALGLAVGIVVDDAIMVMENIYRHAEAGESRVTAAREGTARSPSLRWRRRWRCARSSCRWSS
jgi:multidrug efflux pump